MFTTKICKFATIAALLYSGVAMAEEDESGYQVRRLKFGETDAENYNDYGVITNFYDSPLGEEINENDHLSMVYTIDGDQLKSRNKDSVASTIHNTVAKKVFEEVKGFLKIYIYDCGHP